MYEQAARHYAQLTGATPIAGAVCPRTIVVVVGESANRLHWSLYGYNRPTDPRLQKISNELCVFTNVISTYCSTIPSIRGMMTTPGECIPVFRLFDGAGYRTHWISAQYGQGAIDLEMPAMVGSCDDCRYLGGVHDENLIPWLIQAANEPGRQMIFLNLFGSHVRYEDRYPAEQDVFHGDGQAGHLVATYDNSIHYTDSVLSEMIEFLRQRHEASCLICFSDHGEDVYDSTPDRYLFRSEAVATDPMYEVPFFVWFSPEYVQANKEFVAAVATATSKRFQNKELYQELMALARITHPLYDPKSDLFSCEYVEQERRVGYAHRLFVGPHR
jgi:heptose-I-phosphate ethanolaminephosphotransferase